MINFQFFTVFISFSKFRSRLIGFASGIFFLPAICFADVSDSASEVSASPPLKQSPFKSTFKPTECLSDSTKTPIYGAECQFIRLKEDPDNLDSREIDVYITRLPAIQESQKPPVFFIAGGPGQASSDLIASFRQQFAKLLVDHDFVFVDQRGTGKSNPLNCDIELLDYADQALSIIEKLSLEKQQACVSGYKGDLTRYTTPYAVKDLDAIRKALGYQMIFLWGGSYGTRVIIEYLRAFPTSIAGVILDGVAPVSIQLPTFVERDGSAALARLLELCRSDSACRQAFPNLEQDWLSLLDRLEAKAETVPLIHPRTQKSHRIYIDNYVISAWVRLILYSREITPVLPLALFRATQQDYSQLFSIYALGLDNMSQGVSEGLQSAVLCAEDHHYRQLAEVEIKDYTRLLHLPGAETLNALCALYPKSILADEYFTTIDSNVPALLLSGKLDPVTPPLWADGLSTQLHNSKHVVVEGGHHIVSRLGCVPSIISKFIRSPESLSSINTNCVSRIKAPAFFIDSAGPQLKSSAPLSPLNAAPSNAATLNSVPLNPPHTNPPPANPPTTSAEGSL